MTKPDTLYATPHPNLGRFAFDEQVVEVFPDMIQRSVPGYATIIAMTGVMAGRYAIDGSHCYDLGSSLGASSLAIARETRGRRLRLIGVDNSSAMIERCRDYCRQEEVDIELRCESIQQTDIRNASVVVLNFTLQFVPEKDRQALCQRISDAMLPGGILILSEKIRFADDHLQELNTELHHAFKRANGYSEMEVAQKRSALENVLIPETLQQHQQRLKDSGFSNVDVWFQCFNFASMVAIKQ
ncbi:MAG: carboxy-S-adenosyl-L-methionine synthase CmoA [Spongiibacter sp.]|uniref:Carboxy-S-adenosyl-L-methionine synthase n=1 Tax=Spongiibacter thalassae TaxID=2721624 RepID=A0ABX1GIZ8_9GAMM|nr:carboxy-S-adenosyl-L-methionine synthase CmoA [Spongiibacter thalassae]NKI18956.1 carboxy-S-adenosyl-L-methionine synthase CmoA [Spongiibacter thalassae]